MNKKFLSAILFGALVASTGSFVSCADNDSDIKQLQDQNSELKAQLAQLKSELQTELKNAASASQVAAIEAKLSAIEGVTSDNIAAVVAALKGDFTTQEARVIALETQIKALEGLKDVDANELIAVLNKAKENGTADMAGLSALVDALDAQVNTLISDVRSIVFQPEFYMDGIEAVEYTYLRYVDLQDGGDIWDDDNILEAYSNEVSDNHTDYAPGGSSITLYKPRNKKFHVGEGKITGEAKEFHWRYAHTGDIVATIKPDKWEKTSLGHCTYKNNGNVCPDDDCLEPKSESGIFYEKAVHNYVGKGIVNYIYFAVNPANSVVTPEDLQVAVKNVMAMTRAGEAKVNVLKATKVVDKDAKEITFGAVPASKNEAIWEIEYEVENPEAIITANNDESYSVLNQQQNTTIFKLQAASEAGLVESDWAALYETEIQPVAIALNPYANKEHAGLPAWYAPINCAASLPNELHKNPYEAAADENRTTSINYLSDGVNIAEHIELHFVKRDHEKTDRAHKDDHNLTGHNNNRKEVQHPHVTMTLAEAAYKFGFEYEFNLVPYTIDDNKTNNSSYAHLKEGSVKGGKYPDLTIANAILVPNTVDEERAAVESDKFAYIPKKATDKSVASKDGYEQGASSVDKEPLVQVLVKKDGEVILDGYVSLIITRQVGNVMAPVFDLGEQAKSCESLHFHQTWNQVSELLYEYTAKNIIGKGMSKLEFEETYEPVLYKNWNATMATKIPTEDVPSADTCLVQFNVTIDEDGTIKATPINWQNTYTKVEQEFDKNGITNTVLGLDVDKFDQQYIYEKPARKVKVVDPQDGTVSEIDVPAHSDIIYVMYQQRGSNKQMYADKGSNDHGTFYGIIVPLLVRLQEVKAVEYDLYNHNFWFKADGTPVVKEDRAGRWNVNHGYDNTNSFEYRYASDQLETFKPENAAEAEVLGFVRDLNDAWEGKVLNFTGINKKDTWKKGQKPTYYFHPANRGYEFLNENNGKTYVLDIDYVNIECEIWCDGDDPCTDHGVNKHSHTIVPDAAAAYAKDSMIIKNTEKDHQINTEVGIYKNIYLYAYEKGNKPAKYTKDNIIAELNRYTGNVHYRYNEMSKLTLNSMSHNYANFKVKYGIFLPNECRDAYYINYNFLPTNDFLVYYFRPIDVDVKGGYVTDAVNNADYVQIGKLTNFIDWRDYKFYDPDKANPYENIWLAAFYGIHSVTVDFDKTLTDMNQEPGKFGKLLKNVNQDVLLSFVDHSGTKVIADMDPSTVAPLKGTNPFNLRASGMNKASKGVKSTYDIIVEHFGKIKYMNKGANVSNFHVAIPVTFGYDWGEITKYITIHVNGTEGNHNEDYQCDITYDPELGL